MGDAVGLSNKKKPGRKLNPTPHAQRKAQNRAAQRAFRERKEKHILELETTRKQLLEERDTLMAENKELRDSMNLIGYEGWHLKGVVLSLQLVCFMNSIAIPHHSPCVDHRHLPAAQEEINPAVPTTYADARKKNQSPALAQQRQSRSRPCKEQKEVPSYVSGGSLLVTTSGIQSVVNNRIPTRIRLDPLPLVVKKKKGPPSPAVVPGRRQQRRTGSVALHSIGSSDSAISSRIEEEKEQQEQDEDMPFIARPIMLTREPMSSFSLASLQTMQLHRQLQSVCEKSMHDAFLIEPTALQKNVPHDPRIDLIPIPAMRDRMILFYDLFDLDACISCALQGIEYLKGNPSEPSSWKFPPAFYEKYWYLTHDYSVKDIQQKWPEIKQMQRDGHLQAILENKIPTPSAHVNTFPPFDTIVPSPHLSTYAMTTTSSNNDDGDSCLAPVILRRPDMF